MIEIKCPHCKKIKQANKNIAKDFPFTLCNSCGETFDQQKIIEETEVQETLKKIVGISELWGKQVKKQALKLKSERSELYIDEIFKKVSEINTLLSQYSSQVAQKEISLTIEFNRNEFGTLDIPVLTMESEGFEMAKSMNKQHFKDELEKYLLINYSHS